MWLSWGAGSVEWETDGVWSRLDIPSKAELMSDSELVSLRAGGSIYRSSASVPAIERVGGISPRNNRFRPAGGVDVSCPIALDGLALSACLDETVRFGMVTVICFDV